MNCYFAKFDFKEAIDHLQSFGVFSAVTWWSNYEILEEVDCQMTVPWGLKICPYTRTETKYIPKGFRLRNHC